jgi:rRNA processing protein Gar1
MAEVPQTFSELTVSSETSTTQPADSELSATLSALGFKEEIEFLDAELRELGTVMHYTEGFLIIKSDPAIPLIDVGSKVCLADGEVIGIVDDLFGSVNVPHYSIQAFKRQVSGVKVYYPSSAKCFVTISKKKATDASNRYDQEAKSESSSSDEDVEDVLPTLPCKRQFGIFAPPSALN